MHYHQIKRLMGSSDDTVVIDVSTEDMVFDPPLRALWVGVGGSLVMSTTRGDQNALLENIPDGTMFSGVNITKISSEGTDASSLVGWR